MKLSAKKTIAALLAGLLLFSGCNGGASSGETEEPRQDTTGGANTASAETETEAPDDYALRMQTKDSLPADADLAGETIHIAYMQAYQNDAVGVFDGRQP